jgi:hypothetical protein
MLGVAALPDAPHHLQLNQAVQLDGVLHRELLGPRLARGAILPPVSKILFPTLAAALVVALVRPATGGAAPCPPGTSLTPTITANDPLDGDRELSATHVIVLTAEWPAGGAAFADDATAVWTGPAGVPIYTSRSPGARQLEIGAGSAGFLPPAAGPLPVTVTWEQTDNNTGARCTGSFSTTLQIAAARPLRPRSPRPGGSSGYTWSIAIARNANRSPLEVRFRAVRGARLPGATVPFKRAKFILRPTDTSAQGSTRRRVLNGISAKLAAELTQEGASLDGLLLTFSVLRRSTNPSLGYEIQLLQGGRRVARLRTAARCNAFLCPPSIFRFGR